MLRLLSPVGQGLTPVGLQLARATAASTFLSSPNRHLSTSPPPGGPESTGLDSTNDPKTLQRGVNHLRESLRTGDYEAFLATHFFPAPASTQIAWMAIRCLSLEASHISSAATDPRLAEIRYAYWREVIGAIYARAPSKDTDPANIPGGGISAQQHPIAVTLRAFHRSVRPLSRRWLARLVDERSKRHAAGHRAFGSLDELERFGENTSGTVLSLCLQAAGLGAGGTEETGSLAEHAASHVGQAAAIVNVIRAMRIDKAQGRLLLPVDLVMKHNLREEAILRLAPGAKTPTELCDAVFELATRANDHLITARTMVYGSSNAAAAGNPSAGKTFGRRMFGLLPGAHLPSDSVAVLAGVAIPLQHYLDTLALPAVQFDPFCDRASVIPSAKHPSVPLLLKLAKHRWLKTQF
ncbi:hypothetical protein H696_00239 [Fonticula alba]|uniref:Phytoene synthase n=1 Tax=Fonticula alba TaxID=691883 RepID=A0A058ZE65_FONAL|nr:hypothetical protein H696_00239 [Fonticula alba]KCV72659.1 hypothetical protein H696_00239 [Fonticula alba]|eukprot:XP_009492360.1 hypothetical protein H696_00239 [Fonticula alba]